MYKSINTNHDITVIAWRLRDIYKGEPLPEGIALDAVIPAIVTIMKNNFFEFGDLYFLQLLGTVMGISAAEIWADFYCAYHEVHTLFPRHESHLIYRLET